MSNLKILTSIFVAVTLLVASFWFPVRDVKCVGRATIVDILSIDYRSGTTLLSNGKTFSTSNVKVGDSVCYKYEVNWIPPFNANN